MELKIRLEEFFKKYKKSITIDELIKKFDVEEENIKSLINSIYELEKEGKIIGTDDGYYTHVPKDYYLFHGEIKISSKNNYYIKLDKGIHVIISNSLLNGAKEGDKVFVEIKKSKDFDKQYIGKVKRVVRKPVIKEKNYLQRGILQKSYHKDYYYVILDNEKIPIPKQFVNGAYINDLIELQVVQNGKTKYGKISKIIKRNHKEHVFEYKKINDKLVWVPIGTEYFEVNIKGIKEEISLGDTILANLSPENDATYLKKINNNSSSVEKYLYEYGYSLDFKENVIDEANKLISEIPEYEYNKRVDLRGLTTVTIDGERAKDLDDAVSLEVLDDKYILYVSIADVSYYVKWDSLLFKEAYKRGNSVYPADTVIPMLPKKISNDICSLNPNQDKLTKTCKIEIDKNGNIIDYSVFNSIINSNYRMTYEKVNNILDGIEIDENYIPYYKLLFDMNHLSEILQKRKLNRGFICFESKEIEFDYDEKGNIVRIKNRSKGKGQLIIENFMLLANELIASYAYYLGIPFAYRNHESPSVDQLNSLKNSLKKYEGSIKTLQNASNPRILQKIILNMFSGKTIEEIRFLSDIMLKNMNRAHYSDSNYGHYGLALEQYATFTSPIRKFTDLINHMQLENILTGNLEHAFKIDKELEEICIHCSETQQEADKIEQCVDNILAHDYISNFLDKVLECTIIFVADDFIYVKTVKSIYGIIPVNKNNIRDKKVMIGKKLYKAGDILQVTISTFKKNSNEVIFSLAPEEKIKEKIKKKEV